MRLFLWDVKYKTWNKKKFRFTVQLTEFNSGTFGLGVEFYHTGKAYSIHRLDHYASLTFYLPFTQLSFYGDWGGKEKHDAAMIERRKQIANLTPRTRG